MNGTRAVVIKFLFVREPVGTILMDLKGLMRMNASASVGAKIAVKLLVALVLLAAPALRADTTLIPANAEWRYGLPEDAAVNADWRDELNDSNWRVGPA